jgi:hypothetical protein
MQKLWKKPTAEVTQAMSEVFTNMDDLNVKPVMPTDDEPGSPADKQLMVRCTQSEKDLWKQAADTSGETLAAFVRRALNDSATKLSNCAHPRNMVKFYPWGNPQFFCLTCKERIDMGQIGR